MTAATGRLVRKDDGTYLVLDRIFHAPIEEVWSYLSRSPRLASWVGEFTEAPATGAVRFRFAADDASWEDVAILECQAPHRFVADVGRGRSALRLYCHTVQSGGHTTVTFGRRLESMADCVDGVRWDYYFDRLVAVHDGGTDAGMGGLCTVDRLLSRALRASAAGATVGASDRPHPLRAA